MRRCSGCARYAFEPKPLVAFGPEYCDECQIMDEQEASEARVVAEAFAIECARCDIELGEGRFKCRRARGSDLCLDCAYEMDLPIIDDEYSGDEPGNTFTQCDFSTADPMD